MQKEKEVYDYIFKIIIIGNGSCGKSSMLHYYLNQKSKKNLTQTVGVEFASKIVNHDGKNIKLQLWDTAGQERYRSVARTYYRGALGALVVFDLTSFETFQAIGNWIRDAKEFGRQDINVVVCGNKLDLTELRRVDKEQAIQTYENKGTSYFETSALTGDNIDKAFSQLIDQLIKKIETGMHQYNVGQIDKDDLKPRLLNPVYKYTKLQKSNQEEKKVEQQKQCGFC